MKIGLIFILLTATVCAEITVRNYSSGNAVVAGVVVSSGAVAQVDPLGDTPTVEFPGGARVVEVLEGSEVVVDDESVTVATPISAFYGIFLKGFWTGLGFELFGLVLAIIRKLKARGTGME